MWYSSEIIFEEWAVLSFWVFCPPPSFDCGLQLNPIAAVVWLWSYGSHMGMENILRVIISPHFPQDHKLLRLAWDASRLLSVLLLILWASAAPVHLLSDIFCYVIDQHMQWFFNCASGRTVMIICRRFLSLQMCSCWIIISYSVTIHLDYKVLLRVS